MMSHPLVSIITGFVLWAGTFLLLYSAQATGCYLALDKVEGIGGLSGQRFMLVGFTLLSFGFSLFVFLRATRRSASRRSADPTSEFTREITHHVWLAALFAIPFCFGGAAWLTLCGA